MLAGTVITLLSSLVPWLSWLHIILFLPLLFNIKVITFCGDLPYGYLSLPLLPALLVALYYVGLIFLIQRHDRKLSA